MIQDGRHVNLGDPLSSFKKKRYVETSLKGRGFAEGLMEVGLVGSTRRSGKPATRGSGQRRCNILSDREVLSD